MSRLYGVSVVKVKPPDEMRPVNLAPAPRYLTGVFVGRSDGGEFGVCTAFVRPLRLAQTRPRTQRAAREILGKVESGELKRADRSVTLRELVDAYLSQERDGLGSLAPRTMGFYEQRLDDHGSASTRRADPRGGPHGHRYSPPTDRPDETGEAGRVDDPGHHRSALRSAPVRRPQWNDHPKPDPRPRARRLAHRRSDRPNPDTSPRIRSGRKWNSLPCHLVGLHSDESARLVASRCSSATVSVGRSTIGIQPCSRFLPLTAQAIIASSQPASAAHSGDHRSDALIAQRFVAVISRGDGSRDTTTSEKSLSAPSELDEQRNATDGREVLTPNQLAWGPGRRNTRRAWTDPAHDWLCRRDSVSDLRSGQATRRSASTSGHDPPGGVNPCHDPAKRRLLEQQKSPCAGLSLMGGTGLEPVTPSLSSWCSPN